MINRRKQIIKIFTVVILALILIPVLSSCNKPAESNQETTSQNNAKAAAENKNKPVCWFNRQPSNGATGKVDMKALSFNNKTYYVGVDNKQGAELQGLMVYEYIKTHEETIDRNGDGIIGYVLAIGDIGHNDSTMRTMGVREALGTAVSVNGVVCSDPVGINVNGKNESVKDSVLAVNGKEYKVRELASQEMKNSAGATWDAATAGNTLNIWAACFGDQIDVIVSNNDGMGMAMFSCWAKREKVPVFGYDANSDAVAAIGEGFGGTISSHTDIQAYLTLRIVRNALDGTDINAGIKIADEAENILEYGTDYIYIDEQRSYFALNEIVTADNYTEFIDSTKICEAVSKQLDKASHPAKRVWLNVFSAANTYLGATYVPLLKKYDKLLNLNVDYFAGDGQTESNITDRLANPGLYDAFCINMVKTDNAGSYTALLSK